MALTTKFERDKEVKQTPEKVRTREEAAARCTQAIKRRVLRKQARTARADHAVKCCIDARKEDTEKKALDGVGCEWQIDGKTEKSGIKDSNDSVKKCIQTLKKRGRCRRRESSGSREGDKHFTV